MKTEYTFAHFPDEVDDEYLLQSFKICVKRHPELSDKTK